ncbi:MAG TPA: addiction module protein [Chthoniobacter sp.]|jgi:putative addiction module component (TIGR02574 family)
MILDKMPDVQRLSHDEKWTLIQELWQELLPAEELEPRPEVVELLDARMAEFQRNPAAGSPWAEAKLRWRAARE